ncbi:MAG: hypothetical protein IJ306_00665 [Oscillospiraceae bacterium]|nr:hypothetical protein [Oscillospiraceae bacterium]
MPWRNGPETFSFGKSLLVALVGLIVIIGGMALFEFSVWISLVIVLIGAFIILIAAEAGRGKMRTIFRNPHSLAMDKTNPHLNKDKPFNPWDEVSKEKK